MTIKLETAPSNAPARRGVYLLTHPRSASNMFQTMMAKQPGYQSSGYKLFDAGFATISQLNKGRLSERTEQERKALYDVFRTGFDKLQDELEDARANVSSKLFSYLSKKGGEIDIRVDVGAYIGTPVPEVVAYSCFCRPSVVYTIGRRRNQLANLLACRVTKSF